MLPKFLSLNRLFLIHSHHFLLILHNIWWLFSNSNRWCWKLDLLNSYYLKRFATIQSYQKQVANLQAKFTHKVSTHKSFFHSLSNRKRRRKQLPRFRLCKFISVQFEITEFELFICLFSFWNERHMKRWTVPPKNPIK